MDCTYCWLLKGETVPWIGLTRRSVLCLNVSVDLPHLRIDYFYRGKPFATLSSTAVPPHIICCKLPILAYLNVL